MFNEEVLLPVFIPDAIIKMDLTPGIMNTSIYHFNLRIKDEKLRIQDSDKIIAQVGELVRFHDNLFLTITVPADYVAKAKTMAAKLIGYLVVNKSNGEVEDMVIEGFDLLTQKETA